MIDLIVGIANTLPGDAKLWLITFGLSFLVVCLFVFRCWHDDASMVIDDFKGDRND